MRRRRRRRRRKAEATKATAAKKIVDQYPSETEQEAAEQAVTEEKGSWRELEVSGIAITKEQMQEQANLHGVPILLLTKLKLNGYDKMAMNMMGYLKSEMSTAFDKLSDVAVLLSNVLWSSRPQVENRNTSNTFNANMYLLLVDKDMKVVLCQDEASLKKLYEEIKPAYEGLRDLVRATTQSVLPDCETIKRYIRCYWRMIHWCMENIMDEYRFDNDESKALCGTKEFEPGFAYHEFTGKVSKFVNNLLNKDTDLKTGKTDQTGPLRTLLNMKGGVRLWLSRQTRKLWYIPSTTNTKAQDLILKLTEEQDEAHEAHEVEAINPTATTIIEKLHPKFVKSKGKYDGYKKFLTKHMRNNRWFDRVYITPGTTEQYKLLNLTPDEFLNSLIDDHFLSPGAPILLGLTPYHAQVAFRSRQNFDYMYVCGGPSNGCLCPNRIDKTAFLSKLASGREVKMELEGLDIDKKYVWIVLCKKSQPKSEYALLLETRKVATTTTTVNFRAKVAATKAKKKPKKAAAKKPKKAKKAIAKKAKDDAAAAKAAAIDDDAAKTDMAEKGNTPSVQAAKKRGTSKWSMKRKFVDFLKSKRDGDGQDKNGKKPRYEVHIDVGNQSELMDNFEIAVTDHKEVIDAVMHGIDLVLVSDGNKTEKIQLTTDDFVHNSDNDYSSDDLFPIINMKV